MRVLQLIDSLEAGGAERVAVNLANGLSQKIEGSYLCATRSEGPLRTAISKEVDYIFLKRLSTVDVRALLKLRRFVLQHEIDWVNAHNTSFFLAVLLKLSLPKLRLSWHVHHGDYVNLKGKKMVVLKMAARYFDVVFTVNEPLMEWVKKELKTKHVDYLRNFVVPIPEVVTDFPLQGKAGKRMVCVANLRPEKGHGTLLDAFAKALDNDPEWTLHLFGKDSGSLYSQGILDRIEKNEFRENVFFHGVNPQVSALLPRFDTGVLSSDSEGLPLALLEYGMAGLPVVVTDVGQCRAVVGESGHIVAPGNPGAMASAMLRYMADEDYARTKGGALRERISSKYGQQAAGDKIISTYEAV